MLITSSILFGFIRLTLLLLFLFYLNRKWVNGSVSNTFLSFLVQQWFKFGSYIGIVIFVTIQLGIYDLFNCLLLFALIIALESIGFKNLRICKSFFDRKVKSITHKILKGIELNKIDYSWSVLKKKIWIQQNNMILVVLLFIITLLTFISRIYFFKYDLYSLSGSWISDLEKILDFDKQKWFSNGITVSGDLAFVNFYSKIIGVSPEIALQSTGIIVSIFISIIVFWTIKIITLSNYFAPIIGALSFSLLYTVSPVNINFLLQNNAQFLALTFAIPTMVFSLKPSLLKTKKINYFFSFLFVYITIGLIDLFTLYFLIPPFLIISILLTRNIRSKRFWIGLGAYCASAGVVLLIYGIASYHFETNFKMFLHTNLLSVNSYTYVPQLVIPLENLIKYYFVAAFIGIVILLKFTFYNKEDWKASFAFLIYFLTIICLGHIENPWIDFDLIIQALPVFIPIIIGICFAVIVRVFNPIFAPFEQYNKYAIGVLIGGIFFSAMKYQKNSLTKITESDTTPREILEVYDQISSTYFPYSFAVVNNNSTQIISENNHYFINYDSFLNEYPAQDSIYFKNIKNPNFFKKNPKYVIPKSVLLFIYNDNKKSFYNSQDTISVALMSQLKVLQKRGRKIELFHSNSNFKVYEIINEPKSSKISDLIF